jgi:hypothetical protein
VGEVNWKLTVFQCFNSNFEVAVALRVTTTLHNEIFAKTRFKNQLTGEGVRKRARKKLLRQLLLQPNFKVMAVSAAAPRCNN